MPPMIAPAGPSSMPALAPSAAPPTAPAAAMPASYVTPHSSFVAWTRESNSVRVWNAAMSRCTCSRFCATVTP